MKATLMALVVLAAAVHAGEPAANVLALETTWRTERGEKVTLESLRGRWYALSFVYTSCPGTCPLTTQKLKRLDAALRKARRPIDLVVVSLDPANDTPDAVASYRARYQLTGAKQWRILVGDDEQLRTLTMLLGFKYTRNAESGAILHDNAVYLVGPDGAVVTSMSSLDQPLDAFVAAVPVPARGS